MYDNKNEGSFIKYYDSTTYYRYMIKCNCGCWNGLQNDFQTQS